MTLKSKEPTTRASRTMTISSYRGVRMTDPMVDERHWWMASGVALTLGLCIFSSISCIIPDHGIVALVDCGARWCATAELAEALADNGDIIQVQVPQPDGTTGWVTECVCMTPADDLVLLAGDPPVQYELLRTQVINAARQACLDAAIDNGFDPDPPYPLDEQLEPSCYEAVTDIFRDGCCKMLNADCGTNNSCNADPDPTEGELPSTTGASDSVDTTASEASTGEMSSLEPLYGQIACSADTCHIGQPLIDAILASPELLLAEGTSLRFVSSPTTPTSRPLGLELQGVAPDTLAGALGLRNGDILLRVAHLALTTDVELVEAATFAQSADQLTVVLLRDGNVYKRYFVRTR